MSFQAAVAAMQRAGGCEDCFQMDLGLTRSLCDAPQPRWIGPRYFGATPRVAVVLINPGGGGPNADPMLAREADLFRTFHRSGEYEPVVDYFRTSLARGAPWLAWYRDALGLEHDQIAQLNVAWCPTRENRYPARMLRHCFAKHTAVLLERLDPDVVLLSGGATHRFAAPIADLLPRAQIVSTIHYGHRRSREHERTEASRVKQLLERMAAGRAEGRTADGMSPTGTLKLLDELERLGFGDAAFARLHHFRLVIT